MQAVKCALQRAAQRLNEQAGGLARQRTRITRLEQLLLEQPQPQLQQVDASGRLAARSAADLPPGSTNTSSGNAELSRFFFLTPFIYS